MLSNINDQLLDHFHYGHGAAEYLRGQIPGFVHKLRSFMRARTDIRRLQEGEKVAQLILATMYFRNIMELRSQVATYELMHMIRYKNQYDHTAHTLYLFLFGVWIYDSLPNVKQAIDNSINADIHLKVKRFLFQWTYASLLHDIGYIFDHIVVDARVHIDEEGLYLYDGMFVLAWIKKHIIGDLSPEYEVILRKLCGEFGRHYKRWNLVDEPTPKAIIKKLSNVNWVNDFLPGHEEKKDAFAWLALETFDPTGEMLRREAMRIASEGYRTAGQTDLEPKVDHAVASGLMLFQYTSAWYWLYHKIRQVNYKMYDSMTQTAKYEVPFFEKHIIPACKAVIYHNLQRFGDHIIKFELAKDPLLYLAVLCDELQVWDRFYVGTNRIITWRQRVQVTAEDMMIDVDLNGNDMVIVTEFFNIDKEQRVSIREKLDRRLTDWKRLIQLRD